MVIGGEVGVKGGVEDLPDGGGPHRFRGRGSDVERVGREGWEGTGGGASAAFGSEASLLRISLRRILVLRNPPLTPRVLVLRDIRARDNNACQCRVLVV